MTELWLHAFSVPGRVAQVARQAEEWGFAGLLIADSQNLTADIWVELALAGAVTSRLRLGPGVTNPVTRHLAVTASAAATLQAETGGRATLGIAQGDSALTQIGCKRLTVVEFEHALHTLQELLSAKEVQFDDTSSALCWLAGSGVPKVPVHVAATGPRTIEAAARHAEGVDLTVGADPQRLRQAAAIAKRAGNPHLSVGAYVNIAVNPDRHQARELVRGSVATFARFSERGASTAASGYDMHRHGQATAAHARQLDPEFIDRFAVCGPPVEVHHRLAELAACGLDRLIVVTGSLDSDHDAVQQSNQRLAQHVLPKLRTGVCNH